MEIRVLQFFFLLRNHNPFLGGKRAGGWRTPATLGSLQVRCRPLRYSFFLQVPMSYYKIPRTHIFQLHTNKDHWQAEFRTHCARISQFRNIFVLLNVIFVQNKDVLLPGWIILSPKIVQDKGLLSFQESFVSQRKNKRLI